MAGTYSQIYVQVVIVVKGRENVLRKEFRDELFKYITGIIAAKGQKAIIVNGVFDHVHCFIGLQPSIALSDLVRDIKNNSSRFINEKRWMRGKFQWQTGYGAFSYSHSQIGRVYNYILNQEKHHASKSFREEYVEILSNYEVDYKPEYLFEVVEG